jgi:hypothetical protein
MALSTEKLDLYIPLIDSRNEQELYTQALDVVAAESGGVLADGSNGNPLSALLRGQAFVGSEFLWQINKLPVALVLQFLSLAGIERSLGQKATGTVTFNLVAPRTVPYTIPAGFEVTTTNGKLSYYTDTILTLPAGTTRGTVTVTAAANGAEYNVGAYTISRYLQPLAFLASVINEEDIQGGASAEPVEDAVNRGMSSIRQGNLVSTVDFREAAENAMGTGSRATTIGLLGGDKVTITPGAIHIFCLAPDGNPANIALLGNVRDAISPRRLVGTSLFVSPMETLNVGCTIYANITGGASADLIADNLWEAFTSYLSPTNINPGDTVLIEEVRHQLRFVEGVSLIDYILLNDAVLNIPMPNAYTLPIVFWLKAVLTDDTGTTVTLARGALDDN